MLARVRRWEQFGRAEGSTFGISPRFEGMFTLRNQPFATERFSLGNQACLCCWLAGECN